MANKEAGLTDVKAVTTSPDGDNVTSYAMITSQGAEIKYTPTKPGVYETRIYLCDSEIPGECGEKSHAFQRTLDVHLWVL